MDWVENGKNKRGDSTSVTSLRGMVPSCRGALSAVSNLNSNFVIVVKMSSKGKKASANHYNIIADSFFDPSSTEWEVVTEQKAEAVPIDLQDDEDVDDAQATTLKLSASEVVANEICPPSLELEAPVVKKRPRDGAISSSQRSSSLIEGAVQMESKGECAVAEDKGVKITRVEDDDQGENGTQEREMNVPTEVCASSYRESQAGVADGGDDDDDADDYESEDRIADDAIVTFPDDDDDDTTNSSSGSSSSSSSRRIIFFGEASSKGAHAGLMPRALPLSEDRETPSGKHRHNQQHHNRQQQQQQQQQQQHSESALQSMTVSDATVQGEAECSHTGAVDAESSSDRGANNDTGDSWDIECMSAEEFLRRVRLEAQQCDQIAVAKKIPTNPLQSSSSSSSSSTSTSSMSDVSGSPGSAGHELAATSNSSSSSTTNESVTADGKCAATVAVAVAAATFPSPSSSTPIRKAHNVRACISKPTWMNIGRVLLVSLYPLVMNVLDLTHLSPSPLSQCLCLSAISLLCRPSRRCLLL